MREREEELGGAKLMNNLRFFKFFLENCDRLAILYRFVYKNVIPKVALIYKIIKLFSFFKFWLVFRIAVSSLTLCSWMSDFLQVSW